MAGQDVVYANLAGDLERQVQCVVKAMEETRVGRPIFISSMGIYDSPRRPVIRGAAAGADGPEKVTPLGIATTIVNPRFLRTRLLTERSTNYAQCHPAVESPSAGHPAGAGVRRR